MLHNTRANISTCIVMATCLFLTLTITVFVTEYARKSFYFNHILHAQEKYADFLSAYSFQTDILGYLHSYYNTDRQVIYGEIDKFIRQLFHENYNKNTKYGKPLQVGWFSSEPSTYDYVSANTHDPYIVEDSRKNPYISAIYPTATHGSQNINYYNDGIQIIALPLEGKPPDPLEPMLITDAGYIYIVLDIKHMLQTYQSRLGNSYEVSLQKSLEGTGQSPKYVEDDEFYIIPLDYIRPDLNMVIHYQDRWNSFDITKNHAGIMAFLAGFLASVLLALYIRHIHRQSTEFSDAQAKAEELNRLKSDFLATMSHEIRTPMNGVLGMAELILSHPFKNQQIKNYAQTILNSGESLLKIIDDILDFSKIEAGKLELDPMEVDMLELVNDLGVLYSAKAREKNLELNIRYIPGTEQFVFADPVRIRQLLTNIIGNAIKFTSQGYISLTVEEEKNPILPENTAMFKVTITDTGIGLSREAQQRIFEKFSQADTSTTRQYGGTGLGLSICNSLVNMMNGSITVDGKEGEGATFVISLPLLRNTTKAHITPRADNLKGLKILVVDDLPFVCDLVKEQLNAAGMRCDTALNGSEALAAMKVMQEKDDPYKIVLIDYLMPVMNGEMLANAINDNDKLREACLIMLTSAGNPLSDELFVEKGFSAYIPKPVQNHILIEGIANVWEKYTRGEKESLIRIDAINLQQSDNDEERFSIPDTNILVAEDNLVNQVFIREILDSMGCRCKIVPNGQDALTLLKQEKFDLVIMDCLMPVMDGFETTHQIRELQKCGRLPTKIPILALTANAMKGDRELCLQAGMDDYLSKPVRKRELKQAVFNMIMGETPPETSSPPPPTVTAPRQNENCVLDFQAIEDAREILKDKYGEMVELFIETTDEHIKQLKDHADSGNITALIRPAHTLKSACKQMGAFNMAQIALDIETGAKSLGKNAATDGKNLENIRTLIRKLPHELELVTKALLDKAA